LAGAKCWFGVATIRKAPLSVSTLTYITNASFKQSSHNTALFKALINTGFTGLLHLGELTFSDKVTDCDYCKLTLRHSLQWLDNAYSFSQS
jgi:hypothetical protein